MISFLDINEDDEIPLWLCVHQVGRIKAMLMESGAEDVRFTTSSHDELEARCAFKGTAPTFRADKPESLRQILMQFKKWRAQRGG